MLVPPCHLVLFDCTDNALLLVEIANGHILSRHPIPPAYRPITLLDMSLGHSLLAVNSRTDSALFVFHNAEHRLSRLPFVLPTIKAVCLTPAKDALYLASVRHTLYHLDLSSGKLTALGSAPYPCTALACQTDRIYSVWETTEGSICAVHDANGSLLCEHRLYGTIPSISLSDATLYLPFADDKMHGEGLHLLHTAKDPSVLTTIPLKPPAMRGLPAYPYSVLVLESIVHLINEASGTITKIDRRTNEIIGSYALGRSISHLCLLPDERFAVATSNMFADLTLLDLVNEKLLSISICPHELFHQVVVLPSA